MLSSRCLSLCFLCFESVHKCGHTWYMHGIVQFPVFSYSTCHSHWEFGGDLLFAFVFLMTNVCLSFRLLSSSSRCPLGGGLGEEQLSHPEKRKPGRRRNKNKFESFAKKCGVNASQELIQKSAFVLWKNMPHAVFPTSHH